MHALRITIIKKIFLPLFLLFYAQNVHKKAIFSQRVKKEISSVTTAKERTGYAKKEKDN